MTKHTNHTPPENPEAYYHTESNWRYVSSEDGSE